MGLLNIMLPVFIIFTLGYIAHKKLKFDIKSISSVSIYILSPCLAFRSFYSNPITLEYVYIITGCLVMAGILLLLALFASKLLKSSYSERSAIILSTVFMNSGNYGAPIILFAYGETAFSYAVIILVLHSLLMNTLGIFFAALGGKENYTTKEAISNVLHMPVIYTVFLAVTFNLLHIKVPEFITNGVYLLADATIPIVMLILGMQLASISIKKVKYLYVNIAVIIRMIISPIIAAIVIHYFPISELAKLVFILQMAMPSAANTTMYALRYDTEADLVAFTTFITTLLSIITVPITLSILGY
ncbi:AEC family transporter [Lysinibacillus sp. LZ02]|uniref:AEC family transporter n=1 Tax=Lysinibacillus sp. LZ02 TaxID=3420668 RepID=UPI003D35DC90